jgi:hypothetical protein
VVHVRQVCRTGSGWNCSSILILLESCLQTCMTYAIAGCKVNNSWWRTEELIETCRVSFPKINLEISASSWFYYKEICHDARSHERNIQEGQTALSITHILALSFSVVSFGSEGNTSLLFQKTEVGYVGLHSHRHAQKLGNDTEATLPPRDLLKLTL